MSVFECAVFDENVFDTDCVEEEDIRPVQTTVFRQPVYSHVYEPPDASETTYESDGGLEYYGHSLVTYPNQHGVAYVSREGFEVASESEFAHTHRSADYRSRGGIEAVNASRVSWGVEITSTPVEYACIEADIARGTTAQQVAQSDAEAMSVLRALGVLM